MHDSKFSVVDAANQYAAMGFRLVRLRERSKKPQLAQWQNSNPEPADFHPGDNIGCIFDGEYVDLDFDGAGAVVARHVFEGYRRFGRADAPDRLHVLIKCFGQPVGFRAFPHGEYRYGPGKQTMMPGSTHPDGAMVEWETPDSPIYECSFDEALQHHMACGIVDYVSRHTQANQNRDINCLALARVLHDHVRLPKDWIRSYLEIFRQLIGDDERRGIERKMLRVINGDRAYGLKTLKEQFGESGSEDFERIQKILKDTVGPWPEIDLATLEDGDIVLGGFPLQYFPEDVAEWIRQNAVRLRQPEGMGAVLALGLMGLAAGAMPTVVKPDTGGNWQERLCFFVQVLADQGISKSRVLKQMALGLKDWEDLQIEEFDDLTASYNLEYARLKEAEEDTSHLVRPMLRLAMLTDRTIEGVNQLQAYDPSSTGTVMDELSALHNSAGRYSSSGTNTDREWHLSQWDGAAYRSLRKGDRHSRISGENTSGFERGFHSIVGCTTRASFASVTQAKDFDDGFACRFLSYVVPAGYDRSDRADPELAKSAGRGMRELQAAIANTCRGSITIEGEWVGPSIELRLDDRATAAVDELDFNWTTRARQLRSDTQAGYVAKYPRQAMRLAGLWALMRIPLTRQPSGVGGDLIPTLDLTDFRQGERFIVPVPVEAVEAAQKVIAALDDQGANVESAAATSSLGRTVNRLAKYLHRHKTDEFNATTLVDRMRATKNTAEARDVIERMLGEDLCRVIPASGSNRGKRYQLHPGLLEAVRRSTSD